MLLLRPPRPPRPRLVHARRLRWRRAGLGEYERQLHAVATRIAPAAPPPAGDGNARRRAKLDPTHRAPSVRRPVGWRASQDRRKMCGEQSGRIGRRPSASTVNAVIIGLAHAICTCITTVRISGRVRIHRSCRPNHTITSTGPTNQPIPRVGIARAWPASGVMNAAAAHPGPQKAEGARHLRVTVCSGQVPACPRGPRFQLRECFRTFGQLMDGRPGPSTAAARSPNISPSGAVPSGHERALGVAAARSGAAFGVQRPYHRSWMRVGPAQWRGLIVWGESVAPPSLLVRGATRAGRCDSLRNPLRDRHTRWSREHFERNPAGQSRGRGLGFTENHSRSCDGP